jgi:hypothetical protein
MTAIWYIAPNILEVDRRFKGFGIICLFCTDYVYYRKLAVDTTAKIQEDVTLYFTLISKFILKHVMCV